MKETFDSFKEPMGSVLYIEEVVDVVIKALVNTRSSYNEFYFLRNSTMLRLEKLCI